MVRIFTVNEIQFHHADDTSGSVVISVIGTAATPGYKEVDLRPLEDEISADGIFDMELVGKPPNRAVPQVLTPVTASYIWEEKAQLVGVRVVARSNELTQLVTKTATATIDPSRLSEAARLPHDFTTLALGEEMPTTLAFGEEGGSTIFRGEEGPGPGTLAIGEGPTTLAFGEEGQKTQALGEEGPKPFFGETDPRVDDPTGPIGENQGSGLFNIGMRNPFTSR